MKHERIETRSALPIEVRDESGGDDPLTIATRSVEELRTSVTEFQTRTQTQLTTELRALTERLEQIETRAGRPGATADQRAAEATALERRAFVGFVRQGREALAPEEVRALRVSDDTAGGYLAPAEFTAEVDKNLVQFSPIRQAARVGTTSAGSVIIPRRTGRPTANWVGEIEERTGTESTYGQAEVPIDEMACYVDVSNRLLEDAAVDIFAEVSFDIAEEFGRLEGTAFAIGNGVKKPVGFMSDTNVAYNASGSASVIADADGGVDGLIDLMYALHPFYRSRGVFMANGTTIGKLRKLKDADKHYIWQASLQAGQPDTLLGRPIIEAPDMPDVAPGAYPLAFGDFASAYRIFDRKGLSILRDPYTQAKVGMTRFHANKRVGGRVVRPEAIRKLKIGTI